MTKGLYICVDFDGTCVKHEYPEIGGDIGAVPYLKELTQLGHKLILFTMRSGDQLDEAVQWFADNDIPLFGINTNPTQSRWTNSPKAFGHIYIDDAVLGVPLISPMNVEERPYVDWSKVGDYSWLLKENHETINKTNYSSNSFHSNK